MPNITFEHVQKHFEDRCCTLLEDKYVSAKSKLKFKCLCGNEKAVTTWDAFRRGSLCKECAGNRIANIRKLDFEHVENFFRSQNCTLLDKEYKNAKTKMEFICSCGNYSETTWDTFRESMACSKCGHARSRDATKYTFDYISNYFSNHGCTLLETTYKDCHSKMKYICCCGDISEISFHSFKSGSQCRKCYFQRNSGLLHWRWKKDRSQHELEKRFRKRCYSLLRESLLATGQTKRLKSADALGYTYHDLKNHITNHPNWEKVKDTEWHIDHIYPIQAFVENGIFDLKLINCLDNLQPLAKTDNLSKHDNYNLEEFRKWLQVKNYVADGILSSSGVIC